MFRAELSNPNILKTIFDSVSSIIDEVKIKIDSDGIRLNAIDRGHYTFINLNLEPGLFDEFVCDEPETLTIDTVELFNVLKLAKSSDRVILSSDDYFLIVILEGDSRSRFKIKLIEMEYENPDPPELEFLAIFSIETSVLNDMLKKVEAFAPKTANTAVTLEVDTDYVYAYSDNEMVDVDIKFLHGGNIRENARSNFTIEKVKNIMRADKLADTVTMKLGNNIPFFISFELVDGEISFLLAPRTGED
jgi:proliferating cell nuclear antigen